MNLGVIANPDRKAISPPLATLIDWAERNRCSVYLHQDLYPLIAEEYRNYPVFVASEEEIISNTEFIIAVGGDGTMLWAAHSVLYRNLPILGVNCGRMGFLADIQQEQFVAALNALLEGSYQLDPRRMLTARLPDGTVKYALNEMLFARAGTASMVTLRAEYDGTFINKYWADGLIVSTPTGSTAYNLSSGGPIVMPQTDVIILTPINPHTLTTRPLVLPADREIRILVDPADQDILFSNDGREASLNAGVKEFSIRKSNFTVDLVKLPMHNYFLTLRNKLMWGMDFREQP